MRLTSTILVVNRRRRRRRPGFTARSKLLLATVVRTALPRRKETSIVADSERRQRVQVVWKPILRIEVRDFGVVDRAL